MLPELKTFLLAMTPLGELRVSLPIAINLYNLSWIKAYLLSVFGNLIPVIFLLLFLEPVSDWLSRNFRIFQRFFNWFFERTRRNHNSKMEKYGYPALTIFVAIPLPLTGGWTGAVIAFLFGIPFKFAFPLIGLGVMLAGLIVLAVNQVGINIERYFGWQVLAGIALLIIIFLVVIKKLKNKKI